MIFQCGELHVIHNEAPKVVWTIKSFSLTLKFNPYGLDNCVYLNTL